MVQSRRVVALTALTVKVEQGRTVRATTAMATVEAVQITTTVTEEATIATPPRPKRSNTT